MRDPKRIRPFLTELGDLWETAPDMRFGQLVEALLFPRINTLFYTEDDKMLEAIRAAILGDEIDA